MLVEWGEGGEVVLAGDRPAPIGVWGELCRRGAGGRLERTGRRARRRASGRLELAGPGEALRPGAQPAAGEPPDGLARARSELSKRREDLSEAKRRLLAKRLGQR